MNFLQKLYRRNQSVAQPIIVVSGLPRSGTSMMMKMLEAGGIMPFTDGTREADVDNPGGYYELEKIKDLKKAEDKLWLESSRGKAVKVISYLLKDLPADFAYRVIFMKRSLQEVIKSQNKMLMRRGQEVDPSQDQKTIELFEKHLKEIEIWLKGQANFSVLYVDYGEVIQAPEAVTREILRFLGRELDPERMANVVDEKLYRNRV